MTMTQDEREQFWSDEWTIPTGMPPHLSVALVAVYELAKRAPLLTVDDVRDCLSSEHNHVSLDPVMREAEKRGWLFKSYKMVPSRRAQAKGRKVTLWRSCILPG